MPYLCLVNPVDAQIGFARFSVRWPVHLAANHAQLMA